MLPSTHKKQSKPDSVLISDESMPGDLTKEIRGFTDLMKENQHNF